MSAVVFALPGRPGLSAADAEHLAEVLSRRRSTPAITASGKLREQARLDPDAGDLSTDIELTPQEREAILAVLTETVDGDEPPSFGRLRGALTSDSP